MTFFRVSSLATAVSVSRLLANLVINKTIALYASPSMLAVFAQFQAFMQTGLAVGQGGLNTGIVKYSAEYSDGRKEYDEYVSTAVCLSLICSFSVSILLITFPDAVSRMFFGTAQHSTEVRIFAAALPFAVINLLVLSILNGLGKISTWALLNITHTLFYLALVATLILAGKFYGAVIALLGVPVIYFFITVTVVKKSPLLQLRRFTWGVNTAAASDFLSFSFMTFVGAISAPLTIMIVRNQIGQLAGWDAAGLWQAMWFISSAFCSLATSVISVYFLPKFATSALRSHLRRDIMRGVLYIVPATVLSAIFIYFFRNTLISLLYSQTYLEIRDLFFWQLVGDTLKIISYIFAYVLIGKSRVGSYVLSELAVSIFLILTTFYLVRIQGLVGASYSYAIANLFYFIVMGVLVRKLFLGESDGRV